MCLFTFNVEDQIEAKEPLQPCAARLKLNGVRAPVVSYPNPEVISVRGKTESVFPLLPPLTELIS